MTAPQSVRNSTRAHSVAGPAKRPARAVERFEVSVVRTPYIRFGTTDYSLPCEYTRRTVTVLAEPHRLRIAVEGDIVAEHLRSFDRRATIEDPDHLREFKETKRRSREGAGMSRLTRAVPASTTLIERAAQRGQNMGSLIAKPL